MKKAPINPFDEYMSRQPNRNVQMLNEFFADFDMRCLLRKSEKKMLRKDFENALMYYENAGVTLKKALELIDAKYLGGFYARPSVLWFALDDAAKVYPFSMEHGRMSVFRLSVSLKENIVPELLQMALNFTIKRFPSLSRIFCTV